MSAESYITEQADRVAIIELVQRERAARDMHRWQELSNAYHKNSLVEISWFKGTGAEFAVASQKMALNGLHTFHQMGPTICRIRGNRALSETGCAVHVAAKLNDVDVTVVSHCRLYSRVERQEQWLLAGFRAAYVLDMLLPRSPADPLKIDGSLVNGYRSPYRFLSFVLGQNGHVPRQDLPGVDQNDTVIALEKAEEHWLLDV